MFEVRVVQVSRVEDHPTRGDLTVNHLSNGRVCVSNKTEAGQARYRPGDLTIHVPPGGIIPVWLLQRQGCWKEDKGVGSLGGSKGNRSKPRNFDGIVSDGMLLACRVEGPGWFYDTPTGCVPVEIGQDMMTTLGITEA